MPLAALGYLAVNVFGDEKQDPFRARVGRVRAERHAVKQQHFVVTVVPQPRGLRALRSLTDRREFLLYA
jgi:hypothetical protein